MFSTGNTRLNCCCFSLVHIERYCWIELWTYLALCWRKCVSAAKAGLDASFENSMVLYAQIPGSFCETNLECLLVTCGTRISHGQVTVTNLFLLFHSGAFYLHASLYCCNVWVLFEYLWCWGADHSGFICISRLTPAVHNLD